MQIIKDTNAVVGVGDSAQKELFQFLLRHRKWIHRYIRTAGGGDHHQRGSQLKGNCVFKLSRSLLGMQTPRPGQEYAIRI